jgi:hypothetical protein
VTLDGVDLGTWDKRSGGAVDSNELTYQPGAMAPRISLGGALALANVTVARLYDLSRDQAKVHWMITRVGKGRVVIKQIPLDNDGNNTGQQPITWQGVLKALTPPEVDSTANDHAEITLEVVPDGYVT